MATCNEAPAGGAEPPAAPSASAAIAVAVAGSPNTNGRTPSGDDEGDRTANSDAAGGV